LIYLSISHTRTFAAHFFCCTLLQYYRHRLLCWFDVKFSRTKIFRWSVTCKNLDSSVGIALGYGLYDRWFESRQGLGIFLFTVVSRQALAPPRLLSNEYQGLFPWG
jgi:hypothetical protein